MNSERKFHGKITKAHRAKRQQLRLLNQQLKQPALGTEKRKMVSHSNREPPRYARGVQTSMFQMVIPT
jgi:hypothetical protein